jgi:DNA-binding NtrC family response regulator
MSQKIKLLIVDDEVQFLNALARRLELRDFVVTKAANGEEAIQAISREKFDLALLDLKMPGMDGMEVLRLLKKGHKYLEVIILTGHGSLDSAMECTQLGAYGYVPKPYELEQLIKILKDAYEKRIKKKFQMNEEKMAKITKIETGDSALSVMHRLKELDDEVR